MDHKKAFFSLLALLLFLSYLLPLRAVPLSRTIGLEGQETQGEQEADQEKYIEGRVMEEIKRMDIESNDYPGSGANNRHDPKSPGRA